MTALRSIVALAALAAAFLHARPCRAWQDDLQGTAHGGDEALAVAVDAAGDVIAAGTTAGTLTQGDLTVVKLSGASGAELWRRAIDGGLRVADSGTAIAIDAAGDVAVAGSTDVALLLPRYLSTGNFTVVKLSGATGNELWRYSLPNDGAGARAVAFDAAGNVAAVGSVLQGGTYASFEFFAAVKLAGATGAELWRQTFDLDLARQSTGLGVATAADGDVLAVGANSRADLTGAYFVTRRGAADGGEIWAQLLQGDSPLIGGFDLAAAIGLDGAGDVLTAGRLHQAATGVDLAIVKLDAATGAVAWSTALDGGAGGADWANALAVGASGDAVVGGTLTDAAGAEFAVVKAAGASGSELWRRVVGAGSANAVRIDPSGDVLAAGVLPDPSPSSPSFGVVKLSGTNGSELWRSTLPGTTAADRANALALGPAGDALAAGTTSPTASLDFTVVALAGATGASVPAPGPVCGNGFFEAGELCDDGNRIDGDGCDADCRLSTRCTGGTSLTLARVKLQRRAKTGLGSARLEGALLFAPGSPAIFDPPSQGAQLLIEDLGTGGQVVLDLTARAHPVPPGGLGTGCDPAADGWRAGAAGRFVYRNRSGAIDPPACTPGSAHGLALLSLTDARSAHGAIELVAASRRSPLPPFVGPLRATVVLGAAAEAGDGGACGTVAFRAAQCRLGRTGETLSCR